MLLQLLLLWDFILFLWGYFTPVGDRLAGLNIPMCCTPHASHETPSLPDPVRIRVSTTACRFWLVRASTQPNHDPFTLVSLVSLILSSACPHCAVGKASPFSSPVQYQLYSPPLLHKELPIHQFIFTFLHRLLLYVPFSFSLSFDPGSHT